LLVQIGKQNVLIETGIGDKFEAKYSDIYGIEKTTTLPAELERHGLSPRDIDIVINTHLHFDHCGWNTRRDGGKTIPTFSRARYVVQRGEWEHALRPSERDRASYVTDFFAAAEAQMELLEGDQEIAAGIRVEVVPGHTRDLQCVRIESYPWIMSFDLYPMETLANKHRLLPELAKQGALVIFPHDPEVKWVKLAAGESGIVTQAVE
jgi:glyoxylase-like metal-dependent hydrolase (beta-lactamase superfamily II)